MAGGISPAGFLVRLASGCVSDAARVALIGRSGTTPGTTQDETRAASRFTFGKDPGGLSRHVDGRGLVVYASPISSKTAERAVHVAAPSSFPQPTNNLEKQHLW